MLSFSLSLCSCVCQDLVGADWLLSRVSEMREQFSQQSKFTIAKISTDFYNADPRFLASVQVLATCWAGKRRRVEMEESGQQASEELTNCVSGSITVPLLREVVPIGHFDPL